MLVPNPDVRDLTDDKAIRYSAVVPFAYKKGHHDNKDISYIEQRIAETKGSDKDFWQDLLTYQGTREAEIGYLVGKKHTSIYDLDSTSKFRLTSKFSSISRRKRMVYFDAMSVDLPYRKIGLSGQLIKQFLDKVKHDHDYIWLITAHAFTDGGYHFWNKMKFEIGGVFGRVATKDSDFIMFRKISDVIKDLEIQL